MNAEEREKMKDQIGGAVAAFMAAAIPLMGDKAAADRRPLGISFEVTAADLRARYIDAAAEMYAAADARTSGAGAGATQVVPFGIDEAADPVPSAEAARRFAELEAQHARRAAEFLRRRAIALEWMAAHLVDGAIYTISTSEAAEIWGLGASTLSPFDRVIP